MHKKTLIKPKRELTTEYPVEKLFFLGSKVLCSHRIPRNNERVIINMIIEKLVSTNTRDIKIICEIIVALKFIFEKKKM
jgi:hypothetical protein